MPEWLDHLRALFPVSGVVQVGAGSGASSARYGEWGVTNVLLIEAQESLGRRLSAIVQDRPGWRVASALVGDRDGDVDFYVASNPRESGIIPPDRQSHLWRNLRVRERRSLRSVRLDALLGRPEHNAAGFNWVVIDCLPALPILQGAGSCMDRWDVVLVRALLSDQPLRDSGATKAEVDAFLGSHGFRSVAWEEERQPAVATIAYVRDWKATLQARLSKVAHEREAQIEALKKEHDNRSLLQAMAGARTQAEVDQALRSNVELKAHADALQKRIDELSGELHHASSELEKLTSDFSFEREKLTSDFDSKSMAQAMATAKVQAEVDQARRSNVELRKHADGLQKRVDELGSELHRVTSDAKEREATLRGLLETRDELSRQVQLGHVERDEAVRQKAELAALAAERHEQVSELAAELERQRGWEDRHQAELMKLKIEHDERIRTMQDRIKQLESVAEDRDVQARLCAEQQVRIAQLTRDHDEHARVSRERLAHIEKLIRDGEDQAKRAAEMEKDRADLEHRQRRLDEEFAKAEAQIELIKDVVLREKAF